MDSLVKLPHSLLMIAMFVSNCNKTKMANINSNCSASVFIDSLTIISYHREICTSREKLSENKRMANSNTKDYEG